MRNRNANSINFRPFSRVSLVGQKIWGSIRPYLSWVVLAVVALVIVVYVSVFYYQADKPNRDVVFQTWSPNKWITYEANGAKQHVWLNIVYPERLQLESSQAAKRSLSVWLREAQPTFPPNVKLEPWTVIFSPHDITFSPHNKGVLFTDRKGITTAPQVTLIPGVQSSAPAVLYMQHASVATGTMIFPLTVRVHDPDGELKYESEPLVVRLESPDEARARRFWDQVLGPTTPLLTFVVGLVFFAVEEWRLGKERAQKHKEEQLARVGELEGLRHDIVEAARRYKDYRGRTKREQRWRSPELRERLDDAWRKLFDPRALQDGAVRRLIENDFDAANTLAELALERNPEDALSQALLSLSKSGRPQAEQAGREQIRVCLTLDREHADRGEIEGVRKWVAEKLAQLMWRGGLFTALQQELDDYKHAIGLLGEPEFEGLFTEFEGPLQAKEREAAQRLSDLRWQAFRWTALWSSERPAPPSPIAVWLRTVGLKFNPFGPTVAELDPRLRDYGVEAVFERARGKRPLLVFGPPGCGKTAAALLLAWYCQEPLQAPREADALPVYYAPPLDVPRDAARRTHLKAAARATAGAVARYVAHRREGFSKLPPPRQHSQAQLLSLWAGSAELLDTALQCAGPDWGTNHRLLREVTRLHRDILHEGMTEQAYLNLLRDAKPAGVKCLYLLADLSAPAARVHPPTTARSLRTLLDLIVPLASKGVYLKLFLPADVRPYLGDLTAYEVLTLAWSEDDLTRMLETRFRSAGGYSLSVLCVPPGSSVDRQLVKTASGSPRRLIRVGNALLETHMQQTSGEPQLDAGWAATFLEEWGERND